MRSFVETPEKRLLAECNLHTIIRLPPGVFAPYTGITTNLIFFDKTGSTKEIWFYEHPLPEGRKNYTRRGRCGSRNSDRCSSGGHVALPTSTPGASRSAPSTRTSISTSATLTATGSPSALTREHSCVTPPPALARPANWSRLSRTPWPPRATAEGGPTCPFVNS
jgi:hypothetical protein